MNIISFIIPEQLCKTETKPPIIVYYSFIFMFVQISSFSHCKQTNAQNMKNNQMCKTHARSETYLTYRTIASKSMAP